MFDREIELMMGVHGDDIAAARMGPTGKAMLYTKSSKKLCTIWRACSSTRLRHGQIASENTDSIH